MVTYRPVLFMGLDCGVQNGSVAITFTWPCATYITPKRPQNHPCYIGRYWSMVGHRAEHLPKGCFKDYINQMLA